MFRNALRQSTRAVGAVSAAGRVAAVSRAPPSPESALRAIDQRPQAVCTIANPSCELNWVVGPSFHRLQELFRAVLTRCRRSCRRAIFGLRLTCFSPLRSEMPHPPPSTLPDTTPPTPRLLPLRSLPSSSSESVVSRRSPVSLRLAVSFPSGMWIFRKRPGRGCGMDPVSSVQPHSTRRHDTMSRLRPSGCPGKMQLGTQSMLTMRPQ